jgi:hypothetical protein
VHLDEEAKLRQQGEPCHQEIEIAGLDRSPTRSAPGDEDSRGTRQKARAGAQAEAARGQDYEERYPENAERESDLVGGGPIFPPRNSEKQLAQSAATIEDGSLGIPRLIGGIVTAQGTTFPERLGPETPVVKMEWMAAGNDRLVVQEGFPGGIIAK